MQPIRNIRQARDGRTARWHAARVESLSPCPPTPAPRGRFAVHMRRDPLADLHELDESEWPLVQRLENWARWLSDSSRGSGTHPMFRGFRSDSWDEYRRRPDAPPPVLEPIDGRDADRIQREIWRLREAAPMHAHVLTWYYAGDARGAGAFARKLGLHIRWLSGLLRDARRRLAELLLPASAASAA